ncbi:MAG: sensor histidine kinase [Arachidicoccus sp.]|nr:sensor histidine kinase [Arachidicoccus sp.]
MKPRLLILLIALLAGLCARTQMLNKDSLLKLLPAAKNDTNRIALLLKIQKLYAHQNFDSSFYYLNTANALAKELKTTAYARFINTRFAEYYYNNNDYKKAIEYTMANKKVAESTNDQGLLAQTYNNLAAIYNHFGKYKDAVDCVLKCLDLSEKMKDSTSFPVRYLTASATYYYLKQPEQSIIYAKQAVKFGGQFGNKYVVMMGMNNMSASYTDLNKLDSAIIILKEQLALAKKEKDILNTTYSLINLSYNSFKNGNTEDLEKYTAELNKYAAQMPDDKVIAEIQNAEAMGLMMEGKYDAAKGELDSGIAIANKESSSEALENLYFTYSKLYYVQNKIKEAESYSFKNDSMKNIANRKELSSYAEDIEAKYQTEKKEAQIKFQQASIKQKTTLNYFLIGGAVALLIILLLIYRNYHHRQQLQQARINELETEKQFTATEAVLKGEEQERTRLAKDLHDGLGGMLSGIKYSFQNMKGNLIMTPNNALAFERSMDMLDSSIQEMRRVAHNMMPEALVKFGLDTALKDFCNDVNQSGALHVNYLSMGLDNAEIEQTTAITIYRIVQELLNNTIKHASAKNAIVQITKTGTDISVTIEDDGKGFDTAVLKSTKGIGWSNIQSRIDYLKGKLDVQSGKGKGTSVLIELHTA